jgi:hypothetical protein
MTVNNEYVNTEAKVLVQGVTNNNKFRVLAKKSGELVPIVRARCFYSPNCLEEVFSETDLPVLWTFEIRTCAGLVLGLVSTYVRYEHSITLVPYSTFPFPTHGRAPGPFRALGHLASQGT